jgi:hypothetical protein
MAKADRRHALILAVYEPLALRVVTDFRLLLPFVKILRKYRLCTGKMEEHSDVNLLPQWKKNLWCVWQNVGRKFSCVGNCRTK